MSGLVWSNQQIADFNFHFHGYRDLAARVGRAGPGPRTARLARAQPARAQPGWPAPEEFAHPGARSGGWRLCLCAGSLAVRWGPWPWAGALPRGSERWERRVPGLRGGGAARVWLGGRPSSTGLAVEATA